MKVLFISKYGDSLDIAWRMSLDGNRVKAWIKDPKYRENFDGLVTKVDTWQPWVNWADCVVFDDNGCEEVWKQVHRIKPCFGGSSFGARLEQDRAFAHKIMNQVGLKSIESLSFKRIEEVIAHVKTHKVRHVIKPQGDKVESHDLIISEYETGEDAIALLERFKSLGKPVDQWEVEERKIGVEVGCSAWCAGSFGFVGPINRNFEHKHLNEREVGPLTCEAGTLMKYDDDQEHPYFAETLKKIERILKLNDYRGQIDLNMIATMGPDGPEYWPLEFTPRLGKPAVFIEDAIHLTPWAKLFSDLANGKDPQLQVNHEWAIGVVLFSFGFPFSKEYMRVSHELPILGVENLDDVHLWQAKLNKKGALVTGSADGMTLVTTGTGPTIAQAQAKAYSVLRPIKVPNSTNRFDIGDKIMNVDQVAYGFAKEKKPIEVP